MSGNSLMDWIMRNSTSPTSCLPLLLRHMLNLFFFFSFSFTLSIMAFNGGKLLQEDLTPSEPIDPPHLPWTVYAYGPDGFAREHAVPRNPNFIGNPFPQNTRRWVLLSLCSFFFLLSLFFFFFFRLLTFLSSNCSSSSKSMRSLYGWLGISSWG